MSLDILPGAGRLFRYLNSTNNNYLKLDDSLIDQFIDNYRLIIDGISLGLIRNNL